MKKPNDQNTLDEKAFKEAYRRAHEGQPLAQAWRSSEFGKFELKTVTHRAKNEGATKAHKSIDYRPAGERAERLANTYGAFHEGAMAGYTDRALKTELNPELAWTRSQTRLQHENPGQHLSAPEEALRMAQLARSNQNPTLHQLEELRYIIKNSEGVPKQKLDAAIEAYEMGHHSRAIQNRINNLRPYLARERFHTIEHSDGLASVIDREDKNRKYTFPSLEKAEARAERSNDTIAKYGPQISESQHKYLKDTSREELAAARVNIGVVNDAQWKKTTEAIGKDPSDLQIYLRAREELLKEANQTSRAKEVQWDRESIPAQATPKDPVKNLEATIEKYNDTITKTQEINFLKSNRDELTNLQQDIMRYDNSVKAGNHAYAPLRDQAVNKAVQFPAVSQAVGNGSRSPQNVANAREKVAGDFHHRAEQLSKNLPNQTALKANIQTQWKQLTPQQQEKITKTNPLAKTLVKKPDRELAISR